MPEEGGWAHLLNAAAAAASHSHPGELRQGRARSNSPPQLPIWPPTEELENIHRPGPPVLAPTLAAVSFVTYEMQMVVIMMALIRILIPDLAASQVP